MIKIIASKRICIFVPQLLDICNEYVRIYSLNVRIVLDIEVIFNFFRIYNIRFVLVIYY